MKISNKVNVVLVGDRDPRTLLLLLRQVHNAAMLAKSYGAGGKSELELLKTLHLRLGHRNFADLARQFGLSIPKEIPSCTSCLMGKGHANPHFQSSFERATRRGQGFHSDFRGPFSVATPEGYLYFLSIIDDYSRCVFTFLVLTYLKLSCDCFHYTVHAKTYFSTFAQQMY